MRGFVKRPLSILRILPILLVRYCSRFARVLQRPLRPPTHRGLARAGRRVPGGGRTGNGVIRAFPGVEQSTQQQSPPYRGEAKINGSVLFDVLNLTKHSCESFFYELYPSSLFSPTSPLSPNALVREVQALRDAPTDANDMGKNLVSTLYVNRAAVLHKIGFSGAVSTDYKIAIGLFLSLLATQRGKANASLGNYEDAFLELTVAMNMELSLGGKRQIESELKVYLRQNKEKSSSPRIASENSLDSLDEVHQIKLHCVSTPTKGRGMVSLTDIPQASLLHTEEPYAAILEKLYDVNHIVIGSEMVKLTSIQLALGEAAAIDSINRMDAIFSRYYGSHTNIIFPTSAMPS